MLPPASRTALRSAARQTSVAPLRTVRARRFISTDPPHLKSRTWKGSAVRWGLAAAGLYYYNTSPVFAEHPQNNLLNPNVDALDDSDSSPTLDALTASSRQKSTRDPSLLQSVIEDASESHAASRVDVYDSSGLEPTSALDLEEEAAGEGAFNPVTGEINWDCPCLGGMAHGPCGPEFREAFSCFVYSTEEPKGMECIDKFQNMQNCFRAHPEVYKGEIEDDEELDAELAEEREKLAGQIAERKARDTEASGGRLLEEAGPAPTPSQPQPSRSAKGDSDKETQAGPRREASPTTDNHTQPQPSRRVPSSSEPHPGMSEEHETLYEGQKSSIRSNHPRKPIEAESVVEDELVPKDAYDARNTTESNTHQSAK